ncbi:deleted in malignant brain tumors 1 protein-like isoform X2 [Astyanax mexicanus]|uniref:deleted in malignant brain tumors 1 protein-like isoform X2 n=1 Tax=Astyanax mexicanus TaxID=7994 RepID=UPI0020CB570A|nr:deleted in malignant brain tumors 1 protein-like isoform X2 [Astyanax mexicanus]
MDIPVLLIFLLTTVTLVTSGSVRLVDGGSRCAGRVEVLHRGQWGTVCDDYWDMRDAAVVCRELGCGEAIDAPRRARFGSGSGPIWVEYANCAGSESSLKNCRSYDWGRQRCNHDEDAGAVCAEVRLVGRSHCSGRVEVLHGESWVTVCDADFNQQGAEVVCRELGCGSPVEVLGAAAFGRGKGQVWSEELQCRGNESQIHFCPKSSSLKHNCSHDNDVGLVCADSVRLVDGGHRCAGRVEVFYNRTWRSVCGNNWDIRDAAVVCRELGCGEAVFKNVQFGPRSAWMDHVNCSGSESSVKHCRSAGWVEQICNRLAGVICSGVRLVGRSRCSGRVEVLHGESWVTVCDADFDQQGAEVVCRELGCGSPVEVLGAAAFGRGEGQVWSEELQCRGNESQIHFCPKSSSLKHNCSHDNDVGLACSESVRLVDGGSRCAGRVEVLHKGQWGTVCDDNWDMIDAAVVCRELGCGEAVGALSGAYFGSGSGPIWMDNVECRESESILKNCKSAGWGKHNCNHPKDAGVICSRVRLVGGSHCSGRVEVLHGESWVTVCDADFNQQDGEVVCRDLGCGSLVEVLGAAAFGRGEGQVWSEELQCRGNESQIHFCPKSSSLKHNCSHDNDVGLACSGDKRRLVGGPHACSGRVEKLHRNSWLPVCDADFNQQDAEVVCSWELGCGSPVEVLGAAAFGRAEGQMWSEELQCRGNESHMYLCQTSPSLKPNCSHNKDVGLRCSGHTQARLMNGSDSCSGRVELQYLSEWGTVCDVSWDMRAASVLCAQLKCGSSVAVLGSDWFGEGSGRIWADVFDCQGNETHLLKCPISSWSRTACSHKQDAGVICSGSSLASHEGGVRLSGGMECEVEVFFRQDWRRVLLDSWSESEVSVVCRQLGCGSVLNISSSSSSSPEHSYMCVSGFNCSGSEAHLRNCSSSQAVNCSSTEQIYITCSGTSNTVHSSIRLVGSGGDCAGRLEVFHSGSWGTVSDELWDIEDAQVVCRQLQCGVALSAPVPVPARFGSGTGPIWLNEVECEGNEASLWNCRYQLCGEDECGHKDDVGVVCSEYKEIRLTEGCEGNLEVFYNGTWGNVCVNGMTDETAKLICRELNCGRTGSESWSKARVESAPNWLDNVKCRKHDSTLWHCPSSSWGENRCDNRNEVACITSSENGNTLDLTNWLCDSSPHERPCSKHIPLRLRGGVGSCSGWLQVYHNKTWWSVCGDLWDIRDAQVICRQLGCGPALSANRRAADGSGGGTIWMNRVKCRGNEIHLWDCPHSLKNHTDCSHSAGVTCGDSQPQTIRIINSSTSCSLHLSSVSPGSGICALPGLSA